MDKTKWVVNISSRHLTKSKTEVEVLPKGPKFAPAPSKVPYKEIVANIEPGIKNLEMTRKNSSATLPLIFSTKPSSQLQITSANMKKELYPT